jgi:type IV pilus assembly protein PilW
MRVMRAFTLVELLVALALGAGLVATALTLYARGRAALQTAEAVAQLGEQARYAFATLESDLQMAGYYGLTAAGGDFRFLQGGNVATAAPASALRQGAAALAGLNTAAQACGLQFALDLAVPVQAANNHYAAGADATAACNARPAAASTSDTLTIRRAAGALAAPQAGRLQLLADRSDRARRFVLADGTLPPGTTLAADQLELHELVTRFYYVATDSDGAPGVPALRVKTLSSVGGRPAFIDTEVMSGIEDLQVEFRIDGGYVAPDALPAAAVVRGLRLWLRVRAFGPEADHVDARTWRYADISYTPAAGERAVRRQVIAHLVALRNAPGP